MKIEMTTGAFIRSLGLDMKRFIAVTRTSRETLTNWRLHKPELFKIVVLGFIAHEIKIQHDGAAIVALKRFCDVMNNDEGF